MTASTSPERGLNVFEASKRKTENNRRHRGVGVARRQPQREQFAAVVDDEVKIEAVKPVHARPAAAGATGEDLVRVDAAVVADF